MLEGTFLSLIVIGHHRNYNIKKLMHSLLFGVAFGIVIIVVLIYAAIINDIQLMYFWAAAVVSIWILFATQSINKRTNDNIVEILERVKRIEERLDGLHKK